MLRYPFGRYGLVYYTSQRDTIHSICIVIERGRFSSFAVVRQITGLMWRVGWITRAQPILSLYENVAGEVELDVTNRLDKPDYRGQLRFTC